MTSRIRFTPLRVVCLLALAGILGQILRNVHDPINYHLRCLEKLREGPFEPPRTRSEWFSMKTVLWVQHGCRSLAEWMIAKKHHEDALIQLGYFERRWVKLSHRNVDSRYWKTLLPPLTNTAVGRTPYSTSFLGFRPYEQRVVARPQEIDEYERMLSNLDNFVAP